MSAPRSALVVILHEVIERDGTDVEYLEQAELAGHSLASALDAMHEESESGGVGPEVCVWHDGYEWLADPVHALVQRCGGDVERAQRILGGTTHYRDRSARAEWNAHLSRARIHDAIARHAAPLEILGLLAMAPLPEHERAWLTSQAAQSLSPDQLCELARHESPAARAMLRQACARRDAIDFIERLARDGIELASAVLQHGFGLSVPASDGDPMLALADAYARSLVDRTRPLRPAMTWIARERPVAAWLPILRAHGLGASAAVLHLIEREPPRSPPEIARVLCDAGYGDAEILRGLLENGLGAASTVRMLGEHGWSVDRLVASLLAREVLLPDVRDHLLALGITRAAVEDVLLRHAEAELVALVVTR